MTDAQDPERLAALAAYGILDTPPERGFDRIVHLARRLCRAPVALVSLVAGDRQWFKARSGFEPCETGLDASVCRHALAEPGLLVIPDLTRDRRTMDNPLVTGEPHLRFYAGFPLAAPDGRVIGTLCVLDHEPRPGGLTLGEGEDLEALAEQVMAQLDLRRAVAERDRLARLRATVARTVAAVGVAGGDLAAGLDAVLAGSMLAVPAADGGAIETREGDELVYRAGSGTLARHVGLRLPLDGSLSGAALLSGEPILCADAAADPRVNQAALPTLGMRAALYVPIRRGRETVGVLKLQSSRADAFAAHDLEMAVLLAETVAPGLAAAGEAAARREAGRSEGHYRAVFESAVDHAIVVMDLDGCINDWNAGATRILGWEPDEVRGTQADLFYTPEDREAGVPARELREAAAIGKATDERWHLRRNGERFFASGEMTALRGEGGAHIGFLKILRDRTDQRETASRLRANQERYRLAAKATNDAIWDWDLATNHVLWNEALATAYGHGEGTVDPTGDWWVAHIHPNDRPRVEASIHAVIDGDETAWTDEYRFLRANGTYADVLDRGYVIRDANGRATRMIGAMLDLTERKRAEDARRESERRLSLQEELLRAVVEQAPVGISIAHADGTASLNRRALEMLGHGLGEGGDARYGGYGAVHSDGRPYEIRDYPTMRALRTGEVVRNERMLYRQGRTNDVQRWDVSSSPVTGPDGATAAAVTVLVDVEEMHRATDAVRLSEARLATVMDTVPVGILLAEAPSGRIIMGNRRLIEVLGHDTLYSPGHGAYGEYVAFHADGRRVEADEYPLARICAGECNQAFLEVQYAPPEGTRRWIAISGEAIKNPDGATVGAVVAMSDVDARKQAEADQDILNRELSHRLKNTLALVQSIASQTLRNAPNVEAAREALASRLIALGKAHDILLAGHTESAGVAAVVQGALDLHADGADRFRVSGPSLLVDPAAALSLALMLHELATNAAKYGALSNATGYVEVKWHVEPSDDGDWFKLVWRECGGPPVVAPTRRGFGSRLIERGLSGAVGGDVGLDFDPKGLMCTLAAPLARFRA
ncbi:PAS domain S-box-containing protein [Methylobacterium phyllostachyos]|uniref:Blue-light-activated histidine kinase n=1 Tax=Methylobacterium phyllostachyos TaxID=582672 RepID=A0A1G9U739_9HYPH|nr:PAS domain S-box protein [Methylobacterium phyllostachyos]SDM55770.1 PAS domain S-box-containing protein [Methylobacterium phyllostachyos]